MSRYGVDTCGCFPTGKHYPGIAHLLRTIVRGLIEEFQGDARWADLPIAVIDVETTGRDAASDRVVEVGIVIAKGSEVVARHNWLIHPGVSIPEEARLVHGITDDDVKDSKAFSELASEIAEALSGCIPAAYNAAFDRAFLHAEFGRCGHFTRSTSLSPALRKDVEWFDPLVWAREIHQDERSRALGDVAARLGIALENAHRASDDALATLHVFHALSKDLRVPGQYSALVQEQRRLSLLQADDRRRWRS